MPVLVAVFRDFLQGRNGYLDLIIASPEVNESGRYIPLEDADPAAIQRRGLLPRRAGHDVRWRLGVSFLVLSSSIG